MYASAKQTDASAIGHYRQLLLHSALIGMATFFLVSCDDQQPPTFKTAQSEQAESVTTPDVQTPGDTLEAETEHSAVNEPASEDASGELATIEAEAPGTPAMEPEDATTEPAANEAAPRPSEPAPASPADLTTEPAPLTAMPDAATQTTTFTNPAGPPWALNVMSLASLENAQAVVSTVTALGFTPEISEVVINGQRLYRVRIKGFATRDEATKAGQTIVSGTQYETPWTSGY
ncbi:MAG: hypothetical protein COW18_01030 [Zetaproteobacteria bacterium CG12_big_fil_rev_8_21_14_0_65_54_13]|nr:MAG: hypothetical protein COW18_01030 [Zetaproteobacteria bacterium CG12_big_fil_rev_8_21_14_0_65_54_13]PIX53222.1 MAG: hypothetical protein COZ50_14365 [Zetaproteobacteria bacterium CG_4_10_14_3_um_filter_54_28]PJA30588.1 MAG: hypothetical protein CO188_02945 [Zetaproteobacteria bacterium CG_4_9_14_3_um_filter_54_145]